jgi:hypothetical protein
LDLDRNLQELAALLVLASFFGAGFFPDEDEEASSSFSFKSGGSPFFGLFFFNLPIIFFNTSGFSLCFFINTFLHPYGFVVLYLLSLAETQARSEEDGSGLPQQQNSFVFGSQMIEERLTRRSGLHPPRAPKSGVASIGLHSHGLISFDCPEPLPEVLPEPPPEVLPAPPRELLLEPPEVLPAPPRELLLELLLEDPMLPSSDSPKLHLHETSDSGKFTPHEVLPATSLCLSIPFDPSQLIASV